MVEVMVMEAVEVMAVEELEAEELVVVAEELVAVVEELTDGNEEEVEGAEEAAEEKQARGVGEETFILKLFMYIIIIILCILKTQYKKK